MTGFLLQRCPSQTEGRGRSLRFLVQTVLRNDDAAGGSGFKGTLHTTCAFSASYFQQSTYHTFDWNFHKYDSNIEITSYVNVLLKAC